MTNLNLNSNPNSTEVNIYIALQNDPVFVYHLLDQSASFKQNVYIDFFNEPFLGLILERFPSFYLLPELEFEALLANMDTFLIIENLFGGFIVPQSIYIEPSLYNSHIIPYLESRGYTDVEIEDNGSGSMVRIKGDSR